MEGERTGARKKTSKHLREVAPELKIVLMMLVFLPLRGRASKASSDLFLKMQRIS